MSEWVPMSDEDLPAVMALADVVHPSLPEDEAVLHQRLTAFPEGCLVLKIDDTVQGYAFSHPIAANQPPALNTAPETIAAEADVFYIHDFVVSPAMRGSGQAAKGVEVLLGIGQAYRGTALISVYGTTPFWAKFGFQASNAVSSEKLASYGDGSIFMKRG